MTNNTPDYNDNLYFENKMDCNEIQAKDVACNKISLTEQWKKGEFIVCNAGRCQYYYVQNEKQQEVIKTEYCLFDDNTPHWKILAPVPTFDEWKASYNCMLENEVLRLKNAQLKDLLKEIKGKIKMYYDDARREFYSSAEFSDDLIKKIDEVLK